VRIAATGDVSLGGVLRIGSDNFTTDIQADGDGRFAADVPLRDTSGGSVVLQVESISPAGQGASQRVALRTE
jgi:hypothetical protein